MPMSVAIAVPIAGQTKSEQMNIIQTEAESTKEARRKLSRKTSQVLVSGQLENLIFGEAIAKKGILPYLDSYRRDYTVSERMRLVVAKNSAVELLTHQYEKIPSISTTLAGFCIRSKR